MALSKDYTANKVYKLLKQVCDGYKLNYNSDDQRRTINFDVKGDHLDVSHKVVVHENLELVYVLSTMPFKAQEPYANDLAQAANLINSYLAVGSMDFNVKTNQVVFRIASNYTEMEMTKEAAAALILYTYSTVNKYNNYLHQVATGKITLNKFAAMMEGE